MARTNTRLARLAVVLVTLVGLVSAPSTVTARDQGRGCSTARLSAFSPTATPDADQNAVWAAYGNDNSRTDDWTGGDGTYSVRLPGGRVVWMFSDTFLGTVNPDGTRPPGTRLINNDYVIQRGDALVRTIHGGTGSAPTALIIPADASWYWVSDATVEDDRLRQFVSKFQRTGPGAWDWEWIGTDIASFSIPRLDLLSIDPVPAAGNGVDYGTALLETPDYTYVYGVEDLPSAKYLHLARAAGSVLGPWSYWTGSAWSSNPDDSGRIRAGVSNSFSVLRVGGAYALLTQDSTVPFGSEIVAHFSCSPQGPWGHRTHLYTTPESGGDLYTYNALAHPELTDQSGALVSYNVNTFDGSQHLADVTIYRPRFIRVKFGG